MSTNAIFEALLIKYIELQKGRKANSVEPTHNVVKKSGWSIRDPGVESKPQIKKAASKLVESSGVLEDPSTTSINFKEYDQKRNSHLLAVQEIGDIGTNRQRTEQEIKSVRSAWSRKSSFENEVPMNTKIQLNLAETAQKEKHLSEAQVLGDKVATLTQSLVEEIAGTKNIIDSILKESDQV